MLSPSLYSHIDPFLPVSSGTIPRDDVYGTPIVKLDYSTSIKTTIGSTIANTALVHLVHIQITAAVMSFVHILRVWKAY